VNTTPKKQIAVAVVKSTSGVDQKIHLFTVADLVHLFALAMGYRPDIAFAFGVISRSVPEVQAGECDVDLVTAQKSIRIAEIISTCRVTREMPQDIAHVEAVLTATAQIHTVENAYTELLQRVPEMAETFSKQYTDWFHTQNAQAVAKKEFPALLRWLYRALRRKANV
jgi:hypothetical protein